MSDVGSEIGRWLLRSRLGQTTVTAIEKRGYQAKLLSREAEAVVARLIQDFRSLSTTAVLGLQTATTEMLQQRGALAELHNVASTRVGRIVVDVIDKEIDRLGIGTELETRRGVAALVRTTAQVVTLRNSVSPDCFRDLYGIWSEATGKHAA